MANLPRGLHTRLAEWAETIPKDRISFSRPGTLATNGEFRLDLQGFFHAQGTDWINLQVQHRDRTLFTIYVHLKAWSSQAIPAMSVLNTIVLGAHQSVEEQVLFIGHKPATSTYTNRYGKKITKTSMIKVVIRKRCAPGNLRQEEIIVDLATLAKIGTQGERKADSEN
ncbi:hypothetical protein MMC21_006286 [Puttea exsequens]|nr:hypothetical protein [Puttea exsequens]